MNADIIIQFYQSAVPTSKLADVYAKSSAEMCSAPRLVDVSA